MKITKFLSVRDKSENWKLISSKKGVDQKQMSFSNLLEMFIIHGSIFLEIHIFLSRRSGSEEIAQNLSISSSSGLQDSLLLAVKEEIEAWANLIRHVVPLQSVVICWAYADGWIDGLKRGGMCQMFTRFEVAKTDGGGARRWRSH